MNLGQVFDTLVYGKGIAKRGNYRFVNSVSSSGEMYDLGFKKKELKTSTIFVSYKGETILIIQEENKGREYEKTILYNGINKHNFNKNINRTIERIISYTTDSYSKYIEKYGQGIE